ncbi:MAG: SDR family NAD(P)-dependent oxidoreductase [Chloroflexota bacterium]|nr:SDR family NAD(P)-dependent oxidoreductase [Chloroflexota bacterium]MDE2946876.1 SDR family NAD(P)-dependent oxidoreductase [Chloroflexota bacterium]
MAGRIGLITGAGSGIGRASALALWEAGFTLALAGRREQALRETAAMADIDEERSLIMPTDVADRQAVLRLFAAVKQRFGRLDLLFNNAGINAATPTEDLTEDQWLSVVSVNLTGAFWCLQEAYKLMKTQEPRGGRIINNGSVSAQVPRPNSAVYTATKHAMTGLTKSTALDGRAYDIACGQIDIGNARTEMTDRMERGILQANGEVAVEPTMDARHIAEAVVYMASLPLSVNVPFITVMANGMPYMGRG